MIADDLEHLKVVLEKKPIVGTWTAEDLLKDPEAVYKNYMEHVRSFVVLGRLSTSGDDEQPTVAEYEKRLIRLVKDRAVAKGYITAEYGYGKTSTAIFVWQQCERAEILTVPPFKIEHLHDFISATYGWVRFKLSQSYPVLITKADAIYNHYVQRSIDTETSNEQERQLLHRLHAEGRYNLGLRDHDYLHFFEEMTALAQEAHYQGLVIIADELQQYLETNKSQNALSPLFNIIQALITRQGTLPFGLILSVARQDLGVMGDFRNDLVQRLKSDKLALDLGQIYNQTFARDLWNQLAQELGFTALKDEIVLSETLDALGQISARADLANGPRTVVDVFKLMTGRYTESRGRCEPFSPIDLIDAFLRGDIRYDNTGRLQLVVNGHLEQHFVQGNPSYQQAIKLMAAFPIGGLSPTTAEKYNAWPAIEELTIEARGDIVTFAGGGYDAQGKERETHALLVGLEDRKINTDWLTTAIREFTRSYHEQAAYIHDLAMEGFRRLLRSDVFKEGSWELIRGLDRNLSQDRACIFKGAFTTTLKRYPDRLVHVRILLENELLRDAAIDGDIALNLRLLLYEDQPEKGRQTLPGQVVQEENKTTTLLLNLSHHSGMAHYSDLNATLGQVVAPSTINPILLLSLYAYLDKKREAGAMPKDADEMIRSNFQPLLLDHARQELFNSDLGRNLNGAGGMRIVEEVVKRQLESSYPDYKTLMIGKQWKHSLRDYRDALSKLSTIAERQGKHHYDAKKPELANLFGRTTPSLDNFLSNYPLLLKGEGNGWRFTLHPLETRIHELVRKSLLSTSSQSGEIRHYMQTNAAVLMGKELGYREEETWEVIELLEVRGLISLRANRTQLIEEVARIPQIEELRIALKEYTVRLHELETALPDNSQLIEWIRDSGNYERGIDKFMREPDDQRQISMEALIKKRQDSLTGFIHQETNRIIGEISPLLRGFTPSFSIETLEKPLNEGLFSHQLNTQRVSLLKEYQEAVDRLAKLEQQIGVFHTELLSVDNSAAGLAQSISTYHRLQKDLRQPQERMAQIEDLIKWYRQARQLLVQAQNLQQQLQNAPTEVAASYLQPLQKWSLQVTSELSSAKLNSLKREAQWREQFEQIEQNFRQRLQEEETHFTRIQADFRAFLQQKFPAVHQWSAIVFNASQPEDSYKRLWEGVHNVLQAAVNDANAQAKMMHDRTIRLMSGVEHLPQSERATWKSHVSELQGETSKYLETTVAWMTSVSAPNFIQPVIEQGTTKPAEEVLHNVVARITALTSHLPQIDAVINDDERSVAAAKLSPEEEAMQATLRRLQKETGENENLELGLLLQHLDGQPKEHWQTLASLYSKQRLRINITSIEYD